MWVVRDIDILLGRLLLFFSLGVTRVALHQAAHLAAPDADERAAVAYRAAPSQDAAVAGLNDPPLVRTSWIGHCWWWLLGVRVT